jgi:hypothetical protein
MSNAIKYHFSDFTLEEYRLLIRQAKKNYKFVTYTEFDPNQRCILWRHDIDISPAMALETAKIEAEEGIKATYFILLHSDFYNLLNPANYEIIESIKKLGHNIGLHFDPFFYDIFSEHELDEAIIFEKEILEKTFDIKIDAFSFHNNTPFTLSCENEMYGGLINIYSKKFKSVPYCSDSNGYWRYRRLKDVLETSEDFNLHVLTHEVWWRNEVMSPKQKILKCIEEQGEATYNIYEGAHERLKLINIDWE